MGVLRKDNGNLYFFVNGVDQGLAASNVPEHVFGVVDLYGQAAQATVVQHADHCSSDVLPSSVSSSTIYRCVLRNISEFQSVLILLFETPSLHPP